MEPCEILIYIVILDETKSEQMDVLGKLGINLIHAAFNHKDRLHEFVDTLADGLSEESLGVDMLGDGGNFDQEDFIDPKVANRKKAYLVKH